LLDLLDTENEYFQARRAYVNGVRDHELAHARTQAGMGALLTSLAISRSDLPTLASLAAQRPDSSLAGCAAEAPQAMQFDKEALMSKATPLFKPIVTEPAPALAPAPVSAISAAAPAVEPAVQGAPPAADQSEKALNRLVGDWLAAWMSKDLPKYFSFYASDFKPAKGKGRNREDWLKTRKRIISNSYNINIKAEDVKVQQSNDKAKIEFSQTYRSDSFGDSVRKTLDLGQHTDGQWLIRREQTRNQILNMPPKAAHAAAAAPLDPALGTLVNDWAAAWSARDLPRYFSFYAPAFEAPKKLSRDAWEERRTQIIGKQEELSVNISGLKLVRQDKDSATVEFQQSYRSKAHSDTVQKTLELVQVDGKWLIKRETQSARAQTAGK
jgi:ketosteroid isomerase-like protein